MLVNERLACVKDKFEENNSWINNSDKLELEAQFKRDVQRESIFGDG